MIKMLRYLLLFPGLVFTGVCSGQSVPVTSALSEPVQSVLNATGTADGSVVVDGILDEAIWQVAEPVGRFRQVEPEYGALATLDTEVRVVFDAQYLYIGAVMHDTVGVEGIRVPDLRRDFEWSDNDLFGLSLDGFDDGRTAVSFQVTPYGTLRDLLVIDGSQFNRDWDAVWNARTQITDAGWVAEIAIPWSTLRYAEAEVPVWRANFFRRLRRADEIHAWYPYSRSLTPYYMDNAGQLLGLKPPPPARNLRIQPYLTFQQDEIDGKSDTKPDFGGDLKWAITPNSVLDLTVNTDFAQADADRQVVNLTRFSVFFPEKRAFFLESAELFEVGGSAVALPYFSRRIGLDPTGQPIPLDAGGRFVYRSSTQSLGGLVMRQRQAGETPAALFGVGRYSRNIGERGRVGGLVTVRQDERSGELAAVQNTTASVDGYMRPFGALQVNGMWSQSWTDDGTGRGAAAYTWIRHQSNLGYFGHIQGLVTDAYNPGVGFVGRRNLIVTSPAVWFDLRPSWRPSFLRSIGPGFTAFFYHEYTTRRFQEGAVTFRLPQLVFQSGASITPLMLVNWQNLTTEEASGFRPLGVPIPADDYFYVSYGVNLETDLSRKFAFSAEFNAGDYLNGHLLTLDSFVQMAPNPKVALRLAYTLNEARRLGEDRMRATSHLLGPELRLALNPRVQLYAFYQYNTLVDQGAWNLRFGWEFRPLSYLYLVLNDSRFYIDDALRQANPNRFATQQQVILKVSYLMQL